MLQRPLAHSSPPASTPPWSLWSLLAAALVGAVLGAWLTALLTLPQQPAAAPPPPPALSGAASATAPPLGQAVTFGDALTGPDGVRVAALPPHKIKGGVRLSVSAANGLGSGNREHWDAWPARGEGPGPAGGGGHGGNDGPIDAW